MAVFIEPNNNSKCESISLKQYIEFITHELDLTDQDKIIESAPMMQALCVDNYWLFETINNYLKEGYKGNNYHKRTTSNSFVLKGDDSRFLLRANVWLPESNNCSKEVSKKLFATDFYHDHDFDLLTAGAYGTGYQSDFFEYDYSEILGVKGEVIDVTPIGRQGLAKSSSIFMYANKDIHTQHLPSDLSVSINLMVRRESGKQFSFNINGNSAQIDTVMNTSKNAVDKSYFDLLELTRSITNENIKDTVFGMLDINHVKTNHQVKNAVIARISEYENT